MRKVGVELTVMSTVLADVRAFNPYEYEKIAFQFPVPVIPRATGDGPHYGTISRITQIVAEIKKTPEPCANLALHALEEHWDRLLISADPLSIRHRYQTGIIAHLWSVMKVLRFVFQESSPIQAMEGIVCQLQQERAFTDLAITGVECATAVHPVSIDYLENIIRKIKTAMDYPLEEPCHSNCVVGAVFFEVGKLVSEKDKVDPNTFGADCLVQSAKSVGVPFERVVSVHEMVAVDPNPNGSYPYLPDAWILMFARYLADTIG